MNGKQNRNVLLLALLLASVSAVLAFLLLSFRPVAAPVVVEAAPPSGQPVLIGAASIAAGQTLTASDVEVAYVAPAAKAARVLTDSAQAVGQVALVAIPRGEQIVAGSVGAAAAAAPDTFASDIPVGMRAVAIAMEETIGAGGFVQPGDRVDVIASFELKPVNPAVSKLAGLDDRTAPDQSKSTQEKGGAFPVAELLLQDVEVLAVGQVLDAALGSAAPADPAAEPAAAPAGPAALPAAASVTLLVNPAQALRLLLAVESDAIFRLLLRAPGDATTTELPPALITIGEIPMEPIALIGANLAPADIVIVSARFRQATVPAGGVLEFEATLRNVSPRIVPAGTGGAAPGHVYLADATWQSLAEPALPGAYTLGVTTERTGAQNYAWRWDLAADLAPGESTTISGGIQAPNMPGGQRWWFGTILQPATVQEDGVAPTVITIEPAASVRVIASEIELRDAPWPGAESVLTVRRGARADVLEFQDGWFLLRSGTTDGWVPESAVVNAALPDAAAAATPVAVS